MSVKEMNFVLLYVDDLKTNQDFYEKHLGFKQEMEFRPGEIFGKLGEVPCWMGSGYQKADVTDKSTRATVMLGVESTGDLFTALKSDGVPVVQEQPIEMQEGVFWMQFSDPSGNIIEVLGGA